MGHDKVVWLEKDELNIIPLDMPYLSEIDVGRHVDSGSAEVVPKEVY
jgi:hypothetical protein